MALWGISTTTETAANNYALPKHLKDTDRNTTPWNCFADQRGWVYRRYGTTENSGLSTSYYDEILVPVAGLNTTGISSNTTGLGVATPVAVFFEDPNKNSPISIGAGSTNRISAGTTAYVHVVYNELVYVTAGAQVGIVSFSGAGAFGSNLVAYASSVTRNVAIHNFHNNGGLIPTTNYNGQITNRVSFAFTSPSNAGVGTVLGINLNSGITGVVTDGYAGASATKTFTSDILYNIAGAGKTSGSGIGATTLTIK